MNKSSMNDAAIMLHEFFLSLIKAGFKRREALEIVIAQLLKVEGE